MIRFNLADEKDREFLEKRGVDIKAIKRDMQAKAVLTLESVGQNSPESTLNENKSPKRSKYGNRIVVAEGVKWASQWEYDCWLMLKDLVRLGRINNLKRQVRVKFEHNGVELWRTIPDFYFEVEVFDKIYAVYADAKSEFSANTRSFQTGQKMFRAFYGYEMAVFLNKKGSNIEKTIADHINLRVKLS